ncbi:MAG TPA: rod shape-determining protein MreD [bacterium]|nr:rod shape-determining protein MreD [bacterium]
MRPALILLAGFFLDLLARVAFNAGIWSPDLLLLAVVYVTLTRPLGEAYCWAFAAGLAWDAVYLDVLGLHSFLYGLAGMSLVRIRKMFLAQYALSRLLIGSLAGGLVRFGEVIFWLSNLDYEIPVSWPQRYVLAGLLATGLGFALTPWPRRPVRLPRRSPPILFADRYS